MNTPARDEHSSVFRRDTPSVFSPRCPRARLHRGLAFRFHDSRAAIDFRSQRNQRIAVTHRVHSIPPICALQIRRSGRTGFPRARCSRSHRCCCAFARRTLGGYAISSGARRRQVPPAAQSADVVFSCAKSGRGNSATQQHVADVHLSRTLLMIFPVVLRPAYATYAAGPATAQTRPPRSLPTISPVGLKPDCATHAGERRAAQMHTPRKPPTRYFSSRPIRIRHALTAASACALTCSANCHCSFRLCET